MNIPPERKSLVAKRRDVAKELSKYGWWSDGGTKHEHWTNGTQRTTLPWEREINEYTAKAIIKLAKANPGPKVKQK